MIITFAIVTFTLLAFNIYKKLNNRYQEELFRSSLYELRDELRMLAITKKVKAHNIEFDYLDYSISKTIQESYFITLFYVVSLEVLHKRHESNIKNYKEGYEVLISNIDKNEDLKKIFIKKQILTNKYLSGQNRLTKFIFRIIKKCYKGIFDLKKYFKQKVSEINYYPELSGITILNK
jgi:uncharacterized membrane protein YbaN (DUF454 family)